MPFADSFPEMIIQKPITATCARSDSGAFQGISLLYIEVIRVLDLAIEKINVRYKIPCPSSMFLEGCADAFSVEIEFANPAIALTVNALDTIKLIRPLNKPADHSTITCLNTLLRYPEDLKAILMNKNESIYKVSCGFPVSNRSYISGL